MIIIYILLFLILLYVIITYNAFVNLKNQVLNSYSGIDVQLSRRNDLIPGLVAAVKGYVKHEKELLETLTKKRTEIMNSLEEKDVEKIAKEDKQISNCLKSLFAVAENYPDLKASKNFLNLQDQLSRTENQIAASRRIYNSNVTIYNTRLESFPNNLFNNVLKFEYFKLYKLDENKKEAKKFEY